MTYPVLPEYQGIPQEYQSGATWVSDSSYQGGGYYSNEAGQQYNYAELERLWEDAGGSAESAPYMAYIASNDESGGYVGAWNSTGATGLWQIEYPANYSGSREDLFDPLTNARVAVQMYNADGYGPWGNDPIENLNIPPASSVPNENATVPGGTVGGGSPATLTSATTSGGGTLGSVLGLGNFDIADLAERLGLIVLGAALILLGVYLIAGKQAMKFTVVGNAVSAAKSKIGYGG